MSIQKNACFQEKAGKQLKRVYFISSCLTAERFFGHPKTVPETEGTGIGVPQPTGGCSATWRIFFVRTAHVAPVQWRAGRESRKARRFPVGRYANPVSVRRPIGVGSGVQPLQEKHHGIHRPGVQASARIINPTDSFPQAVPRPAPPGRPRAGLAPGFRVEGRSMKTYHRNPATAAAARSSGTPEPLFKFLAAAGLSPLVAAQIAHIDSLPPAAPRRQKRSGGAA